MYFLPNRILWYCHTIVYEKIPLFAQIFLGHCEVTLRLKLLQLLAHLFVYICVYVHIICKCIYSTQAWIRALKSKEDSLCCTFAEF